MTLIGYARVSTNGQDLALQLDALTKAGCDRVFEDKVSGVKRSEERPGLEAALSFLRPGDVLVVWKLDRLGRSLPHLIETVGRFDARQVGFRSLTEKIDTTTPGGKLIFNIFASLAEFERDSIRERTRAGLDAAKRKGASGGRPRAVTPEKLAKARVLIGKGLNVREAAMRLKLGRSTLYAALGDDIFAQARL